MRFEVVSFDTRVRNVSPRVWGKGAWVYLHTSALTYPLDDDMSDLAAQRRSAFRDALRNLPLIVPCAECRGHLEKELGKIDLNAIKTFNEYNSVILWLHNQVRERQNKPLMTSSDLIEWLKTEGLDPEHCSDCLLTSEHGKGHRVTTRRQKPPRSVRSMLFSAAIGSIFLAVILITSIQYAKRNRERKQV